jgi:8-oxo-dGTP diphosphatase
VVFDHDVILADGVERLEHTTIATAFCGPSFTIGDLRDIYEVVWGSPLDARNFSRKVTHTDGFIRATARRELLKSAGRRPCIAAAAPQP